ncbi:MAG: hypothetical protein AB1633_09980 [Elusimicrobiota bacterium]
MSSIISEKAFEEAIEQSLIQHGGYAKGDPTDFDRNLALDYKTLFRFIKRIVSFLFVYFLDRNNYLYRSSEEKKINDNALTALSLLIAVSDPRDKDILIKITTNLLGE